MDTFGKRLKWARQKADLNQSQLARMMSPPLKPQAIQHLENPAKSATGSKRTLELARACKVNPNWLATGKGDPYEGVNSAREPAADYDTISEDARQVAIAFSKLSPDRQGFFRDLIFLHAALEQKIPWLRRGRPKGETYDEWEKRQEQNFAALFELAANRKR